MKNNLFILSLSILFIGLISCEKKNEFNENINSRSTITHITDQSLLSKRIVSVNQVVEFKGAKANELNFVHKWNITPSIINGQKLSASAFANGYGTFYAGWHTRGDAVNGELMVIDWESLYVNDPIITETYEFEGQEINDLFYGVNFDTQEIFLFAAGKAEKDFSGVSNGANQAMAFGVLCDNSNHTIDFNGSGSWEKYLPAFSANSITFNNIENNVIVSTGSNGGLTVFDINDVDDVVFNMEMNTSRHYDRNGRYAAFLFGVGSNESKLYVWDYNNPNTTYEDYVEYTIPYGITPSGKNGVAIDHDWQHVNLAMGKDGLVKVNLSTGEVVDRFYTENGGFCNSVASQNYGQYLYVAYGSEGLYILDKDTYEVLGNWNFDGSCNYVEQFGPYVALSNGDTDGFILLENQPL